MKNKIVSYVTLMVAVLIGAQAQAALISFGNNWSTNYSATTAQPKSLSGTGGTNASVSFQMDPTSVSGSRGGVYNTFSTTTLGTNTDDAITYKFTIAFYDPVTGTATNTNRKVYFGVAGTNDKMSIAVCSGTASGTKIGSGLLIEATNSTGIGTGGELFRIASTATTNVNVYGTYTLGPDTNANTTYTMVLKRLADSSATFSVAQEKPSNNWSSGTQAVTKADADALSFDKVFIGWSGSLDTSNMQWNVTNLSLDVIPAPLAYYTLTVNSGSGSGSLYTNGQQVAIAANAPVPGMAFSKWTGDTQYVASVTASNTTVTMPAGAVTLTATYAFAKPDGLVVFKNWNFDGDGVTGGTVDSGTSGTDWVKNSADSVLAQFNSGTYGPAFTNANKDTNLYVDTDAGTLIYQSPVTNQNSRVSMYFGTAKPSGWFDMRALAEKVSGDGSIFQGQVKFLSTNGTVLASISMRQVSQVQFITYGAVTNTYSIAGTPVVTNYNGYKVAWKDKAISFYFDDEARGGAGATNLSDTITADVGGIMLDVTTSGSAGKVTVDKMNIEVSPPFALTVNNGTGGGVYTNGVVVPIAANAPINGQYFDKWTGDTQYVASVTASNTTVTMPAQNIALTATYAGESYYTLTITNGTGGGAYSNGTQVAIAAGAPPAFGYLFDQWTGNTQVVANVSSASTTVTMSTNAVTLVATYKAVSVPPAEAINVSSTWSINANAEAISITGISAAAGTNAAVSFNLHSIPGSWAAGGLYNSIRAMTLGPVPGDYISLNFTVAVATNTGTAVDLDRKLSFGLAGTDDKLWALFDTGLANGSSVTYGGYVNNPVSVNGPYLYRGDVTQPVPGITLSSVFTNGAGIALDTTYTLSLMRTDTGAALYVSQIKADNNWNSAAFAITNADAITLDKLFIGINGNNGGGDFIFTVTNLSLSSTYVTYGLTVNGGSGSGAYTNGHQVAIAANSTPGRTFVAWIGDTQYVASATASNTTVTVPTNEITLTATYDQSILTVSSGTGGGSYTNGHQVQIVASELPEKIFVEWTGDTQYVASVTSSTTTVTMPVQDIALTATYVSKTYVLTVYGGSGDGSYTNGRNVTILASTNPPRNFVAWIGDTQYLAGAVSAASNTVVMSTNAVTLTATFDQCILTVNNGDGGGTYTNTQVVPITASNAPSGQVFAQWTGDTQYVASVTASNTTVTMPVQDISLTATYADAVVTYALTVTSGTGGGSYTNGHVQAIAADVIGGKTFVHWTGDTGYLADSNSASTTVTMPAQAVVVTATYVDTTYALTVTSGTGGGSYTNGQQVGIAANAPAGGYAFDKWTGDTQFVASVSSASTTVTMPAQAIALTATYIATEQYTTNAIPVPYSWLAGYGITNNQNAAVLLDPDGDGLTTEQEYIAGTVPTNAASVLKAAQTTRNVITWIAQSNRTYSVYWSTNLVKGFALKQDNIMYPTNNFTNSTPDSRINHYQVKVRMQ